MPILPAEVVHYPPTLFEQIEDGREWIVTHTRPRQEKALSRELHTQKIPFYLPCDSCRVKIRSKIVTSYKPLFTGYVFARISKADLTPVRFNPRVATILTVHDQKRLWQDLQQVRQLLDLGEPVSPETRLEAGTAVTIREGPLTGMTGVIVQAIGGFKFVVQVDFIRQGLSVLVSGSTLGVVQSSVTPLS